MRNFCNWPRMGIGLLILLGAAALMIFTGVIWFWPWAVGAVMLVWGFLSRGDSEYE